MTVSGKDAEVFLERLVVADLRKLQLGEGMLVHYRIHIRCSGDTFCALVLSIEI